MLNEVTGWFLPRKDKLKEDEEKKSKEKDAALIEGLSDVSEDEKEQDFSNF